MSIPRQREISRRALAHSYLVVGLFLAMLTRVSADWMPDLRMSHYARAAVAWVVAVLVWMIYVLPGVRHYDDE